MLRATARNPQLNVWPGELPYMLRALLARRGVMCEADAGAFLRPDIGQLHDPTLLHDMARAVERIRLAQTRGERVAVYGDYDVDGVSAAAMLSMHFREIGIDTESYIPSRHTEGYGLNESAVRARAGRCGLLVTVDCGISDWELIALGVSLGMDAIVTDHHRPGARLPDCPVVNPMLGDYPFHSLCGAGVAFKLICALSGMDAALKYIDLAALATVADIVPLAGENRAIVKLGLDAINADPRPGIDALIRSAGLHGKPVTSNTVAYQLAPRLNAGGRVGDAKRSLQLLDGTGDVLALAAELEDENVVRRSIEKKIADEAGEMLRDFDFPARRVISLCGEDWSPGVIGLAASRLASEYHYPVILLAGQGDNYVGSCRSIPNVNIHEALTACERFLVRYGGHHQAAGLTVACDQAAAFLEAIDEYLWSATSPDDYIPELAYDCELPLDALNLEAVEMLERMQPTGFGNPAPVFLSELQIASARGVGADNAHLKLTLQGGARQMDGICFGQGALANSLRGTRRQVAFVPSINQWRESVNVQLDVRAFLPEHLIGAIERFRLSPELHLSAYFMEMLNIEGDSPAAEPADRGQIADWLRESPQGTLIAAVSARGAVEAGAWLESEELEGRLDVFAGRWPDDPRCFNALCLCPSGAVPGGYSRVVLWDIPGEGIALPPSTDVFLAQGVSPADWLDELPDIDALRALYQALRRRENWSKQAEARLIEEIAGCAGQSALRVRAGLKVLARLGLVEVSANPPAVRLCESKKCEPERDALFRRLQGLREYAHAL